MKTQSLSLLVLFTMTLSISAIHAQDQSTAGKQTSTTTEVVTRSTQNYLLYLPKNYDDDNSAKFPLMLFLHGAGERGNNEMAKVKAHGPPKLIAAGRDFPCIVVSPQCPTGRWWDAAELAGLLDHIEATHRVDKNRIYLTGLSMGGYGTWALAMHQPDRFAAIAPVCGGGNAVAAKYTKPVTAPVWAFHGAKDNVVPMGQSKAMVAAMKHHKQKAKLTIYPEAGHDSWTETYNNEELYTWFMKHDRSKTNE